MTARETTRARNVFKWAKDQDHESFQVPEESNFREEHQLRLNKDHEKCRNISRTSPPIQFYKLFVDKETVEFIHEETNRYNIWRSNETGVRKIANVSVAEVTSVIGMIQYMGIHKLPNRRAYWTPATRVENIAGTMIRNRFDDILRTLHFVDNSTLKKPGESGFSRTQKIQPLVDRLTDHFKEVTQPETYQSVDEMMVAFKGHHGLKVYMKNKPTKWGYKLWSRAGISGFVYDLEICGSPTESMNIPGISKNGEVVLRLLQPLRQNKHKVFFDNLFSTPELFVHLRENGMFATATLNVLMSRKCPIKTEKELKKSGRGSYDTITDEDGSVIVCAWYDNKRVLTISNYQGPEPLDNCRRWNRAEKKDVQVPRPAIIRTYNMYMGGVDKADMLLSFYKTKCRSRKWYLRIAFHLFNLCMVNAWLLYREFEGEKSLLDFTTEVALCLISGNIFSADRQQACEAIHRNPRLSLSMHDNPITTRHDRFDHWPFQIDSKNAQRCKMIGCTRKTRFMCSKCHVYLCVIGSTCFIDYHGVQVAEV